MHATGGQRSQAEGKELQEKFDFEEKQRQKERENKLANLKAKKEEANRFETRIK